MGPVFLLGFNFVKSYINNISFNSVFYISNISQRALNCFKSDSNISPCLALPIHNIRGVKYYDILHRCHPLGRFCIIIYHNVSQWIYIFLFEIHPDVSANQIVVHFL